MPVEYELLFGLAGDTLFYKEAVYSVITTADLSENCHVVHAESDEGDTDMGTDMDVDMD